MRASSKGRGFLALALLLLSLAPLRAGAQGQGYRIGFSPGGSALSVVLDSIRSAKSTIRLACYEFTSRDVAEALEEAAHRGVRVMIVADWKASLNRYSQIPVLRLAGIPVRVNRRYAIMHDKFMVIDEDAIETGSFNYSDGAVKHNAENAIWEWGVRDKAAAYRTEWERLWAESSEKDPPPRKSPRAAKTPAPAGILKAGS